MRTIGNRVRVTPPRVRIPPSPPVLAMRRRWKSTCGVFVCRFMSHAATQGRLSLIQMPMTRRTGCFPKVPRVWQRTPIGVGRHRTGSIATAARAHCWRRHQQCPSATPATGWAYAKSAPGACWMQCPTRHLGSGRQHPERPLTRECQKLDYALQECLPRNEALAQLQNSQLSEERTGFH